MFHYQDDSVDSNFNFSCGVIVVDFKRRKKLVFNLELQCVVLNLRVEERGVAMFRYQRDTV